VRPPFNQIVYSKLSGYYFFYFAVLGTVLPYLSLYFQSLSFSAVQIGQLMAILMATKIVSPNLMGWWADRQSAPIKWVRISSFLAFLIGAGLAIFSGFWAIFWVLLVFSFFWNAALPQYETYTFQVLAERHQHRYGHIRLWGSIGFIAAVMGVGWQVQQLGIQVLPWDVLIILGLVWLSSLLVKDFKSAPKIIEKGGFWKILKQPKVQVLLGVSFLMQLSHGTYYGFYSILLAAHHYTKTDIAWLWSLGVFAEIAIFLWMLPLLNRYSVKRLILVSLALTFLRWGLIPLFVEDASVLIFSQLLHAASFGLFHASAILLINRHFQGQHQGKGQALFAASSHGLGGALGLLLAGYFWQYGGGIWAFSFSATVVLLAFIWGFLKLERQ
jgi:PPP family 3-phenylpropionic acid transporter